jgi:hypothetical protein
LRTPKHPKSASQNLDKHQYCICNRRALLARDLYLQGQHFSSMAFSTSSTSRVRLVEARPDPTAFNEMKSDDGFEVPSHRSPKHIWLDHVLGIFCIQSSKKMQSINDESKVFQSFGVGLLFLRLIFCAGVISSISSDPL